MYAGMSWHGKDTVAGTFLSRHGKDKIGKAGAWHGTAGVGMAKVWHGTARKTLAAAGDLGS